MKKGPPSFSAARRRALLLLASLLMASGSAGAPSSRYQPKLRVPEVWLFWPFFLGFFAYHFWIKHAWVALDRAPVPEAEAYEVEEEPLPAK